MNLEGFDTVDASILDQPEPHGIILMNSAMRWASCTSTEPGSPTA